MDQPRRAARVSVRASPRSGRLEEVDPVEMRIASEEGDSVTIRAFGRMHAGATDHSDGNLLLSPVEVSAGAFTGHVAAGLRVDELVRFREELQDLYRTLKGEARLDSMEQWLRLTATGDGIGHVEVVGSVKDQPGTGNELRFTLKIDQTFLPEIIDGLLRIEQAFPILGKP
jgi:hypothetical protein